jgi:hypothetical protein
MAMSPAGDAAAMDRNGQDYADLFSAIQFDKAPWSA